MTPRRIIRSAAIFTAAIILVGLTVLADQDRPRAAGQPNPATSARQGTGADTTSTRATTESTPMSGSSSTIGKTTAAAESTPTARTAAMATTTDVKLVTTGGVANFSPDTNYADAFTVSANGSDGNPLRDTQLQVAVRTGDAQVYVSGEPLSRQVAIKTDQNGTAKFSVVTGKSPSELIVVPFTGGTALISRSLRLTISGPRYNDALSSRRAYYELFVGQTFSQNFDAQGANIGFGNAGQLIRLTFDTMWKRSGSTARMDCASGASTWRCSWDALRLQGPGLRHTELNMESSKFPFAIATGTDGSGQQPNATPGAPLENAFSGTVGYTFQPDAWASYTPTSKSTLPYDAVRWGVFARGGLTSRAHKSATGQTSIDRIQVGLRFTHHQTDASIASAETSNYVPIRFVELSYEYFSEFAGVPHVNRLVVDAGIRLTPLSNSVFPFYAGLHLNTGKGQDDIRFFLGVLMKLDRIAELVKTDTTGEQP